MSATSPSARCPAARGRSRSTIPPTPTTDGMAILRFTDGRLAFNPLTYVTTAVDRRDATLVGRAIVRRRTPS